MCELRLEADSNRQQSNVSRSRQKCPSNFYMDDYLKLSLTVEEATLKAKDLVTLRLLGSFKLTKFVSNVPSIAPKLEPGSNAPTKVKEIPNTEGSSHVLGLKWNHSTDTLVVSRGTKPDVKPNVTQKVVLSLVSAVYDPIALVTLYTVKR